MINEMKSGTVYDISVSLGSESIDFPGDTPYSREWSTTRQASGTCCTSRLILSSHAGTHIDLPLHFIPEAKPIEQYDVREFILPAQVIDIRNRESIRNYELEKLIIQPGDALLFKTANSTSGNNRNGTFTKNYVYLSAEASEFCVSQRVALVGIDYISIDKFDDETFPAHFTLSKNGILILEGINLENVPPGRYNLFCLPLKVTGGEASPVRAILISQ